MARASIITQLGGAVRQHRFRLGISQEELAARADLHRTYIAGVESGTRNVTLKSVGKLAQALGISIRELMSDSERADGKLVDILLVEDNEEDAEMVLDAFREAKIMNAIRVARDGEEALEYLFGGSALPEMVLLDLNLPKVGGLEVLRRMKAEARTRGVPVVALSASQRNRDAEAARSLGAAAHMVKPVRFENFSRVIVDLKFQWALVKNGK